MMLQKYTFTVNGKQYSGYGKLTFRGQCSLIDNGDLKTFSDYVGCHGLLPDAEKRLITSNKLDWFRVYVNVHSLDYDAEKLLLIPGREDWLATYISRPISSRKKYAYRLNPKLEEQIVLSDNFELFKTYVDRCGLQKKSEILLINYGKFDWFKYYVKNAPVDFETEKWLQTNKKEWFEFYKMTRTKVR